MKESIRLKMTAILILIVGAIIAFICLINSTFAVRYYTYREKKGLVRSYYQVKKSLKEYDKNHDSTQLMDEMDELCESTNVKIIITKPSDILMQHVAIYDNLIDHTRKYYDYMEALMEIRSYHMISDSAEGSTAMDKDMYDWITTVPDASKEDSENLKKNNYIIKVISDEPSGQKGIYLFGFAGKDYTIGMRVSMEGIRENVSISSRFIIYIGIFGLLIGSVIMFIYSASFTKPIRNMADVANRMANLDFDAKVTDNRKDELGELGDSMNKMSEKLEESIMELKSANLALRKDIEKKEEIDEMRKEFISHVSHELKTPIALIQGYAEGLMENINEDAESRNFYCEVIADEANKMNEMVKKLLSLNQLESGMSHLDIVRFDICQVIDNKIQASKILFDQKAARIVFHEKRPVYVWADELMIEEVVNNYLSNAIHYVTEGGIVRIRYEYRKDTLRVFVFNEGSQIPPEELEKLWIKFYKVDKARTREYGGSGIGLSIVAATMKAHHKDYGVQNTEDGVEFYFDLDLAEPIQEQI